MSFRPAFHAGIIACSNGVNQKIIISGSDMVMCTKPFVTEKGRTSVCQVTSDTHVWDTSDGHTKILHCDYQAVVQDILIQQPFPSEVSTISEHKIGPLIKRGRHTLEPFIRFRLTISIGEK